MEDIKFEKIPSGIFDKVKTNKEKFIERFIDDLEELFPDTVKDGKVDFQALLERFGEYQDNDERYELTWVGKNKARQESFEDIVGRTLKYIEEDSKNPDTTENLYIEGDNLEVLKLLRQSYYGKIKMIYIDPPYNTGNDFIYKDDFIMSKEEYDELKGDLDEYGDRLVKNTADSGRYHSNWLNMMYPRLCVARDLLTDDGVIFISIDDNEVHNMKKICDEIFGENNFIAQSIRKRRQSQANLSKNISPIHEYVFIYSKSERSELNRVPGKINEKDYRNPDNDPRGPYVTMPCTNKGGAKYSVITPAGNEIKEEWRFKKETYNKLLEDNKIVFPRGGKGKPRYKLFLEEKKKQGVLANTWWSNLGSNQEATKEFKNIMGNLIFNNPKPIELIKFCIQLGSDKDSIALDFFSGSATTAHAIMDLNAEDGGNRKFIMVQLPEPTDEKSNAYKEGYENICEIGKERIRRAGDKILEENKDREGIENLDIGFKVFKVEDTNFKRIKDVESKELENRYKSINEKDQEDFNPHFTDIDVVYELMLRRQDIKLTEEIKKLDSIGDRTYIVGDTMLICLEEQITEETVDKIGDINTDLSWIVLRDSAFDDNCELKINTTRKLRSIIKSSRKKNQKIYWI